MTTPTLIPSLATLRNEFNRAFPTRDKTSDGWIGDQAHAATKSDHNPDPRGLVHAIDVDADLRTPGWTMQKAVDTIVTRHRTNRDQRLQYVIWNQRIWSDSWGWTPRPYGGVNPHNKHAHFSARYTTTAENDTHPWGLFTPINTPEEFVMASRDDVKTALREILNETHPYTTNAGLRLEKAGWGKLSVRGLLEYITEDAYTQREATSVQLEAFRQEVLAALTRISADPGNSIQLSDAQVGELAQRLTAALPAPAAIAQAVADETSRRMQD